MSFNVASIIKSILLSVLLHSVPDESVRPKQLSCSVILFDHRIISGD